METKRLILAIALSALVFIGWRFIAAEMGWLPVPPPVQNASTPTAAADATVAQQTPAPGSEAKPATASLPVFAPADDRLITIETPLYKAVFHSQGGVLKEFLLKNYKSGLSADSPLIDMIGGSAQLSAPLGLTLDDNPTWTASAWSVEGDSQSIGADAVAILRFKTEIKGLSVVREMNFSGSNYTILERVSMEGQNPQVLKLGFTFGAKALAIEESPGIFSRLRYAILGGEKPAVSESQHNLTRVAWLQDNSFDENSSLDTLATGTSVSGKVAWIAVMNNYFMGAVSMDDPTAAARGRYVNSIYHVLLEKSGIVVSPGTTSQVECAYFLGPKEATKLGSAPNHMSKALDYGMFSIIAKPLVYLLQFLYSFAGNYGVAIVLMTIIIKIVFWPLSQKSYKSMQQMKQLQPLMARIREKHAGDKETMNKEIMQLYKTYKVNPAGGCLPILVQIPVFIGLYQALLNAIELRHAPFIASIPFTDIPWLTDLAAPDPYCITPLVMGATMLLQQKLTPAPMDPTQAKVMMLMPIIFTALFLNFSSGLVVYWLINNIISIGQQWTQLRRAA